MKTLVIKTENYHNANLIASLARALKMDVKELSKKALEDYHFAKLIDEAMEEKGEIKKEKMLQFVKKHAI